MAGRSEAEFGPNLTKKWAEVCFFPDQTPSERKKCKFNVRTNHQLSRAGYVYGPDQPWSRQLPPPVPVSHVFSRVAFPLTILHSRSMGNPVRTRSSFNIADWFGKKFPRDYLQYPDLKSCCDTLSAASPVNYSISAHLFPLPQPLPYD